MNVFQKHFDLETDKLKDDIFLEIYQKREIQEEKKTFLSFDKINYRRFEIKGDHIEIKRFSAIAFQGIGIISMDFNSTIDGTRIKCTVEPISKYGVLIALFSFCLFLVGFTAVVLISVDDLFQKVSITASAWTVVFVSFYLILLYHKKALEEYLRIIFSDLNISCT